MIANFASLIAIIVMTLFSKYVGLDMHELQIPEEFKVH